MTHQPRPAPTGPGPAWPPNAGSGGGPGDPALPGYRTNHRAAWRTAWRDRALAAAPGAARASLLGPGGLPGLSSRPSVLLVRPDHLGDVLFCAPALAELRSAWPEARITLLVGPWSLEVALGLPGLDAVATLPFPWFDRAPRGAPWRPYTRLLRARERMADLPGAPYDLAIVLRDDDYWGAWLTALAGIPLRAGHDRPGVRRFVTHALTAPDGPRHAVQESAALIRAVIGRAPALLGSAIAAAGSSATASAPGPLRFEPTEADRAEAERLLAAMLGAAAGASRPPGGARAGHLGRGPGLLAIHPGSGAAVKRWRAAAWRDTVAAISGPDTAAVVTGSRDELDLATELVESLREPSGPLPATRVANLAGLTSIGVTAAVYRRAALVLGPDSGPLHLAVAVGAPTVHLYGPADVRRFGPWGPPERHAAVVSPLPCAPCGRLDWTDPRDHPCVRCLTVGRVASTARQVLERSAGAAPEDLCGGPDGHL